MYVHTSTHTHKYNRPLGIVARRRRAKIILKIVATFTFPSVFLSVRVLCMSIVCGGGHSCVFVYTKIEKIPLPLRFLSPVARLLSFLTHLSSVLCTWKWKKDMEETISGGIYNRNPWEKLCKKRRPTRTNILNTCIYSSTRSVQKWKVAFNHLIFEEKRRTGCVRKKFCCNPGGESALSTFLPLYFCILLFQ